MVVPVLLDAQQLLLLIIKKKVKTRKKYQSLALKPTWQILIRVHQQLSKTGETKENLVQFLGKDQHVRILGYKQWFRW